MGDTHVRVQIGREEEKQLQAPLSAEAEDKELWAPLSSPLRAVALGSFKSLFLYQKSGHVNSVGLSIASKVLDCFMLALIRCPPRRSSRHGGLYTDPPLWAMLTLLLSGL